MKIKEYLNDIHSLVAEASGPSSHKSVADASECLAMVESHH